MSDQPSTVPVGSARSAGSSLEVLWVATKLGLTSFGGPIAHLGYFHDEYVRRRQWLDEGSYADLVALCQFAPGPTSSKVGFSIGLLRADYLGGLAAWVGFTLPSALALLLFASGADSLSGPVGTGLLHGLKLVGYRCPGRVGYGEEPLAFSQLGTILFGAVAGAWLCRHTGAARAKHAPIKVSRPVGVTALAGILRAAPRPAAAARAHRIPGDRHDGGVLPIGRAGVRRRAHGPALAAGGGGRA